MSFSIQNSAPSTAFYQTLSKNFSLDSTSFSAKTDTVAFNNNTKDTNGSVACIKISGSMIIRRVDLACIASNKAGDHAEFFHRLSEAIWEDGDLQVAYHEFSASLSKENLDYFLTALEQNPDNLAQFIDIVSQLSEKALSPFLEGASLAGEDVGAFLDSVSDLLEGEGGASSAVQYTFLMAGVNRGNEIMEFVSAVEEMSGRTLEALIRFADSELTLSNGLTEDMDLFALIFSRTEEEDLLALMDFASGLADIDKTHLLEVASVPGIDLGHFIRQAENYAGGSGMSHYLEVAADANGRLGAFMALAGSLDLSIVSRFSAVDTANFLDAAQRNPDSADKLAQMGQTLDGTDRNYFFYAAANTENDVDGLLENAQRFSGQALSDFLIGKANEGQDTTDTTIFMTAILDDSEYDDFKSIADNLDGKQINTLIEMTDEFSVRRRSEFLSVGAASGEEASEFLTMFDSLSSATKADYFKVAMELDGENLKNFAQASVNAGGKIDDFIQITGQLITKSENVYYNNITSATERAGLDAFLSLTNDADPDDLQGFISLVGELESTERSDFLRVADRSGLNVGDLTRLGNKALALGHDRFRYVFGQDNLVAGNTTLSAKDYENLIDAAKSKDDNARFLIFYRNHRDVDLLV